jgi:hypothetical protein
MKYTGNIRSFRIQLIVCLMVFDATFNNISVISWRSLLLVEETGIPGKNPTDLTQVTDKLYHIMLYTSPWRRFDLTTSVVIGTDCIGSCKSNQHYGHDGPKYSWQITIYNYWVYEYTWNVCTAAQQNSFNWQRIKQ